MTHYASRDFQARLEQLNAGKPKHDSRKKSFREKLAEKGRNALYPLSFVGAFLLGMVVVFLVRFIRFQIMGPEGGGEGFFLADFALSAFGAWGFAMMLKLRDPLFKKTQGFGVTAAILFMHNLAFWAPQSMSALFSPNWVETQHIYALPNTVNVMGYYIPFIPEDKAPKHKDLPKVTYMN